MNGASVRHPSTQFTGFTGTKARMLTLHSQASAGLEFAATDASIIILSRTSSEVEELTQKGVELEASATYVFRIKGIRSEKGQATLGLRVRSERGGCLIADASERRFWGGALSLSLSLSLYIYIYIYIYVYIQI